jgi:hypothetical protein
MQLSKLISPLEQSKLIQLNDDTVLKEAIKKVLLYNIYNAETLTPGEPVGLDKHWVYGLDREDKLSDEEVGKKVKIKIAAMAMLEDAFMTLGNYRAEVKLEGDENPAL